MFWRHRQLLSVPRSCDVVTSFDPDKVFIAINSRTLLWLSTGWSQKRHFRNSLVFVQAFLTPGLQALRNLFLNVSRHLCGGHSNSDRSTQELSGFYDSSVAAIRRPQNTSQRAALLGNSSQLSVSPRHVYIAKSIISFDVLFSAALPWYCKYWRGFWHRSWDIQYKAWKRFAWHAQSLNLGFDVIDIEEVASGLKRPAESVLCEENSEYITQSAQNGSTQWPLNDAEESYWHLIAESQKFVPSMLTISPTHPLTHPLLLNWVSGIISVFFWNCILCFWNMICFSQVLLAACHCTARENDNFCFNVILVQTSQDRLSLWGIKWLKVSLIYQQGIFSDNVSFVGDEQGALPQRLQMRSKALK